LVVFCAIDLFYLYYRHVAATKLGNHGVDCEFVYQCHDAYSLA